MSLDVVLQVGLLSKFVRANTADKHFLFLGDACYNTDILFNLSTEKSIRGSQRPFNVNFGQQLSVLSTFSLCGSVEFDNNTLFAVIGSIFLCLVAL